MTDYCLDCGIKVRKANALVAFALGLIFQQEPKTMVEYKDGMRCHECAAKHNKKR